MIRDLSPRLRTQLSPRRLGFALAALVAAGLAITAVVALVVSATASDVPPSPPPFAIPGPANGISAYDVLSRSGDSLTVRVPSTGATPVGPSQNVAVSSSAKVEVVQPATAANIHVGAILTLVGVPNQVKNFAINWVVILPPGSSIGSGHIAHTPAGFTGSEADPSLSDRPILSGTVTAMQGNAFTLHGPAGDMQLTIDSSARPAPDVIAIQPGSLADIAEGARVAGNFEHGPASSVLVFPASTR